MCSVNWVGTALHVAAKQGSLQMVQVLVSNGAHLDGQDKRGKNALISCG